MQCARAIMAIIFVIAASFACQSAWAQRGNAIDTLAAQMKEAGETGHNAEGLALAQKLEALVRRQQGTSNMNYAGVLHNQGMFLYNLGRYPEAVDKLNAALAVKLKNNDAASTLRSSNILTAALARLERRAEASAAAERALAIGTRAFGPDDARVSGVLSALGDLARDQENYKDAERYFERALMAQQKSPLAAPLEVAESMDNLGDVYGLEGRFDDGERMLSQSLKLLEQTYGGSVQGAPSYQKALNDLGNLYKDAGRFSEAEKAFGRSLVAARASLGEDHHNVAATMGNLATVLEQESRLTEAEDLYKRTLAIYEKRFGPNTTITAIGLNNLANVYAAQGRIQEAAGLQQRVLAIYEKALGPESPDVGRSLNNLANSYADLGRRDEALPLYERALRIMEKKFGENSGASSLAIGAMGRILKDEGRFEEAAQYLERELKIDERALGPEHPHLVNDLRSVGVLETMTGNYADARARLERALAIAQAKLGARHHDTIAATVNLADVDGHENKWPAALALLRRASVAMEADGRNDAQFKRFTDLDSSLIEAVWRVADGKPDDAAKNEAFGAAQRARETQAGAALSQMAARFGAGNDAIASVVRRQQDLKASLDSLEKRITTELGAPDGKRNDALITSLRAESVRARQSFEETSARIAREFPAYAELSSPAPLTIAQTQALLKPDEALVSFFSLSDKSYVFAVTRETNVWQQIPLGNKAISDQVSKLRLGLFDPAPDAAPKPFDLDASFDLYSALIGPVESAIANKPKLLVVPTGALTSLPFHVLVTKKPDPKVAPEDRYRLAAWLLNDKATTVLPSVASLRALRVFARTSRATKPFIGFGDPQLRRSGGESKRAAARGVQPYESYYRGSVVDIEQLRTGLPALPDTADELRAVARDLGATDDDVKLGAAATVTLVRATPLEQYRVIDFATHGLVAGEVSGLSEPALVLSLPDKPTAEDDGLLTASRIAKLNLDADWAVLSACNTAAGDKPGAEGLSGLARAFFYAGARSLLVSYWPVESSAAVKLTTGAFAGLRKNPGIGRAEALRRSIQALIADRSSAHNADPTAWAPFVLVGEGG
ncbi:CHAT domain-containing tetratricopeptide repeat protein [Bradyrhizobium sp. dw_411]|uniref:CHAT domain-containing tetratricopeptide repeat protein n=1 Tax=Bradyrhizobium sp. dw_411 TaxID=2720082 RepID=UPI001BD15776|nr:CHAT domain-containing tetratricopeptide repeat protein [Bradyrhizobium sp. dw_411]